MYSTLMRALVYASFVAFGGAMMGSCEPCNDPSQVWCPDEW